MNWDETSKKLPETKAIAEESFLYSQIKEIVENCYDIGKIEEIYEIFGGYVNRSFGLYTVKDGERQTWFFRKYMRHKDMNELMLEHKLLTYAKTARIYQRRSAGTRERRQHLLF